MRISAAAITLLAAITIPATPSAAWGSYPVNWDTVSAIATGALFDVSPPGANRWFCHPSSTHPYPVVLVHGLLANQNITWQALAPTLANEGYCVYTFTYGKTWYSGNSGGIDDMRESASQLASFINVVRSWTGASKVDLVGHSEGANLSRLYIKENSGLNKVHTHVSLAGVNMGPPTASGIITVAEQIPGALDLLGGVCPACGQLTDQAWFDALNNPATYPAINYTAIVTANDEAVTPVSLGYLPAAGNVSNLTIQAVCPADEVGHLGLPYDRTGVAMALNALDPAHPRAVPCDRGFPL
ncbi:MAG TPA: lipase [Micromonosporaceae bacterium]|nr:lipase [Micromonosporaceae bacterium]HCU48522.1 lipase [Micromonosporaceae bacterium]